jgi:hypothetical protein
MSYIESAVGRSRAGTGTCVAERGLARSENGRGRESPVAAVMTIRRTAPPAASGVQLKAPVPVIPMSQVGLKVLHEVLSPAPSMIGIDGKKVAGGILISPEFYPLNCTKAPYGTIGIRPPMLIRPNDVGVKPVDKVSPSHVALELYRTLDGCELVLDLDIFIVDHTFGSGIPDSVRLHEGKIQLHLAGVSEPAVLRV